MNQRGHMSNLRGRRLRSVIIDKLAQHRRVPRHLEVPQGLRHRDGAIMEELIDVQLLVDKVPSVSVGVVYVLVDPLLGDSESNGAMGGGYCFEDDEFEPLAC